MELLGENDLKESVMMKEGSRKTILPEFYQIINKEI